MDFLQPMQESYPEDFSCIIEQLIVLAAFHEHERGDELSSFFNVLCEDTYYEVMLEGAYSVFENTQIGKVEEDDGFEEIYQLSDPITTRFFSLCRRYEKLLKIKSEQNPFLQRVDTKVNRYLGNGMTYDSELRGHLKKPKSCRIIFRTSAEFRHNADVVLAFFDMLDFVQSETEDLEKALTALLEQRTEKIEERMAA